MTIGLLALIAAATFFGAALYVLLWIPVLDFFLIPLAIVGGTLLYRGLEAAGAEAATARPAPTSARALGV